MEQDRLGRGGMSPRLVALYGNIVHINECYRAMGVYLRLQKLTPPVQRRSRRRWWWRPGVPAAVVALDAVPVVRAAAHRSSKVQVIPTPIVAGGFVRKIVEHARHTFNPA